MKNLLSLSFLCLLLILAFVVGLICYPVGAQAGAQSTNNICDNSFILPGDGTFSFDNTNGGSIADSICGASDKHLWYVYDATCTGNLTVSLCNENTIFDTTLAIYDNTQGCAAANAGTSNIACNDDFCSLRSQISIPVIFDHDYTIRIGGYDGTTGIGEFSVTCEPAGDVGSAECGTAQQACQDAVDVLDPDSKKGAIVSACAQAANPFLDSGRINEECHSCIVSEKASKNKEGTNCGPASCEGSCGEQSPEGCSCDEDCFELDNCCDDVCEFCSDLNGCNNSCNGSCFDQAPGGCFCDEQCDEFGDCCDDVCEFCSDLPACNSCQGNCGVQAPGGCWCDEACFGFGDCCDDVCDFCSDLGGCNSCEGNCGDEAPGGCFCDEVCDEFDDCCDDVCEFCSEQPFCI